jgi:L-2-amino-thiazoline-4-carboxylic acid hydrolase
MAEDVSYSPDVRAALSIFLAHDARYVRLLHAEVETNLGPDGLGALEAGLDRYGSWMGSRALSFSGHPHDGRWLLRDMLLQWGAGDLGIGSPWASISLEGDRLRLVLTGSPVMQHFELHGAAELTSWYYAKMLAGAAKVVAAPAPDVECANGSVALSWEVTAEQVPHEAGRRERLSSLVLTTAQARGALMAFTGRQMLENFGATGEFCLRSAMSRFGAERGALLRQQVLDKSLELNIENMINNYDSGGHTSVWRWAPGGELSPTRQFQDCTYCPFIPVWAELEAMDIGRIYDYEFHVAQFRAYNPAIRLKWDAIQTEGADHCAFRFSLPLD